MKVSNEVQTGIKEFLILAWPDFISDAKEYDGMDLTVAISKDGTQWNYQTGDNSFTGSAYNLPHWAVTTLYPDSELVNTYQDIISQLDELLWGME